MCISKLGQIVYGAFALVAVALILAAMFTPGWRKVQTDLQDGQFVINMDLFGWTCFAGTGDANSPKDRLDSCVDWYKNRPSWEKIVLAGMILALLASIFAFVWNLLTFCACFCRGSIHKPLSGLALIAALILGASLGLFYYKNHDYIQEMNASHDIIVQLNDQNDISYSFYTALGALALLLIDVVIGGLIVCFADNYL